jgi:hypothetical protein
MGVFVISRDCREILIFRSCEPDDPIRPDRSLGVTIVLFIIFIRIVENIKKKMINSCSLLLIGNVGLDQGRASNASLLITAMIPMQTHGRLTPIFPSGKSEQKRTTL